jgi:hypothetical protein
MLPDSELRMLANLQICIPKSKTGIVHSSGVFSMIALKNEERPTPNPSKGLKKTSETVSTKASKGLTCGSTKILKLKPNY